MKEILSLRQRLAKRLTQLMDVNPSVDRQAKLAAKTGVSQSTVQRLLSCNQAATVDMLEQIAPAFSLKRPEFLLLNSDEVELLKAWDALPSGEKDSLLGYISVTLNKQRAQISIETTTTVEEHLRASQRAAASRPAQREVTSDDASPPATQTRLSRRRARP